MGFAVEVPYTRGRVQTCCADIAVPDCAGGKVLSLLRGVEFGGAGDAVERFAEVEGGRSSQGREVGEFLGRRTCAGVD